MSKYIYAFFSNAYIKRVADQLERSKGAAPFHASEEAKAQVDADERAEETHRKAHERAKDSITLAETRITRYRKGPADAETLFLRDVKYAVRKADPRIAWADCSRLARSGAKGLAPSPENVSKAVAIALGDKFATDKATKTPKKKVA